MINDQHPSPVIRLITAKSLLKKERASISSASNDSTHSPSKLAVEWGSPRETHASPGNHLNSDKDSLTYAPTRALLEKEPKRVSCPYLSVKARDILTARP